MVDINASIKVEVGIVGGGWKFDDANAATQLAHFSWWFWFWFLILLQEEKWLKRAVQILKTNTNLEQAIFRSEK